MAITIDYATRVITVPQSFLTLVSGSVYEMDLNTFRLALKDLEDDAVGMAFPDTHRHNTEVVLAGITYARVIEIINGYTVTFEDGMYAVNLIGANSNVADVTNVNQVSVRPQNSAGLIGISGLTTEEKIWLSELYQLVGLKLGVPMTVTPTTRAVGAISQTISGDGETTTTVTRDP